MSKRCWKYTLETHYWRLLQARKASWLQPRAPLKKRIVSTMNCHRGTLIFAVRGVKGRSRSTRIAHCHSQFLGASVVAVFHLPSSPQLLVSPSALPKFVLTALLSTSTVICSWHWRDICKYLSIAHLRMHLNSAFLTMSFANSPTTGGGLCKSRTY